MNARYRNDMELYPYSMLKHSKLSVADRLDVPNCVLSTTICPKPIKRLSLHRHPVSATSASGGKLTPLHAACPSRRHGSSYLRSHFTSRKSHLIKDAEVQPMLRLRASLLFYYIWCFFKYASTQCLATSRLGLPSVRGTVSAMLHHPHQGLYRTPGQGSWSIHL